ncbi:hypothetical protein R1sor_019309 [Riccia sorocarpa]|uniref:Uncharacterized protein n=1 Tax=Riccia sorocarpa TaxID=122646 RepID=A0ABD3IEW0_9MARC
MFTERKQRRIDSYFKRLGNHETFSFQRDELQGEITEDSCQGTSFHPSPVADEELSSTSVGSFLYGRQSEDGFKKYRLRTRRQLFEARSSCKWGAKKMRTPAAREKQKELKRRKLTDSEHAILRPSEEGLVGDHSQDGSGMTPVEDCTFDVMNPKPMYGDAQEELISTEEQWNTTTALEPTGLEECEAPSSTPADLLNRSTSENKGQTSGKNGPVFDISSLDQDIADLMKTLTHIFQSTNFQGVNDSLSQPHVDISESEDGSPLIFNTTKRPRSGQKRRAYPKLDRDELGEVGLDDAPPSDTEFISQLVRAKKKQSSDVNGPMKGGDDSNLLPGQLEPAGRRRKKKRKKWRRRQRVLGDVAKPVLVPGRKRLMRLKKARRRAPKKKTHLGDLNGEVVSPGWDGSNGLLVGSVPEATRAGSDTQRTGVSNVKSGKKALRGDLQRRKLGKASSGCDEQGESESAAEAGAHETPLLKRPAEGLTSSIQRDQVGDCTERRVEENTADESPVELTVEEPTAVQSEDNLVEPVIAEVLPFEEETETFWQSEPEHSTEDVQVNKGSQHQGSPEASDLGGPRNEFAENESLVEEPAIDELLVAEVPSDVEELEEEYMTFWYGEDEEPSLDVQVKTGTEHQAPSGTDDPRAKSSGEFKIIEAVDGSSPSGSRFQQEPGCKDSSAHIVRGEAAAGSHLSDRLESRGKCETVDKRGTSLENCIIIDELEDTNRGGPSIQQEVPDECEEFVFRGFPKEDTTRRSKPLTDPVREAGDGQAINPESILDRLLNASRSVSCLLEDLNPRIEAAFSRVTNQAHSAGDTGLDGR